ncbi:MAG: hypothetical protein LQ344_007574 [Seirophora lacunosa]|nr:MAG: hypothetical protein LQ344_007574 [Seirophora lacunosa]
MVNLMKLKRFDPLKFARTDKPEGTPKIKVPPHLARTKGEQERQRTGHMVECSKCSDNYKMVGRYCAGCKAVDKANVRKKGEELAAEKKRSKMEDKDKWYREI